MWKLKCVLSPFLYATWAVLSSLTCLILNKTSPQAVFEFFIYATEKKKQQQQEQQQLQKSEQACLIKGESSVSLKSLVTSVI